MVNEEDAGSSSDLFIQGMMLSAVSIGGYMLGSIVSKKFNSFSLGTVFLGLNIFCLGVKILNHFWIQIIGVDMIFKFAVALFKSTHDGFLVLNHSKIIRPDLQFVSVSIAVGASALASQVSPKLGSLPSHSIDFVLISLTICSLACSTFL